MTDRQALLAAVERQERLVAEWESRVDAALAAMREADSVRGEDLVDDPAALDELSGRAQAARERADLAQRAQEAAQSRLDEARCAVVEFDATELDEVAEEASRRLESHRSRTARLLAQLAKHEGLYVPAGELMAAQSYPGDIGTVTFSAPKSSELEVEELISRLRPAVLRDVAAGVDPALRLQEHQAYAERGSAVCGMPLAEFYPATVWGPNAVIPCPAYLAAIDQVQGELDGLDVLAARKQQELEGYRARLVEHQERLAQLRVHGDAGWRLEAEDAVQHLRLAIPDVEAELSAIPARREEMQARLEELTGEKPANMPEPASEQVAS